MLFVFWANSFSALGARNLTTDNTLRLSLHRGTSERRCIVHEGNRCIVHEGNRCIVHEGNQASWENYHERRQQNWKSSAIGNPQERLPTARTAVGAASDPDVFSSVLTERRYSVAQRSSQSGSLERGNAVDQTSNEDRYKGKK
jgi:hypothetical protein